MAVRAVYKTPPRTSSAPSPIRNILASQFVDAHNRTVIQGHTVQFVPAKDQIWHYSPRKPGVRSGRQCGRVLPTFLVTPHAVCLKRGFSFRRSVVFAISRGA